MTITKTKLCLLSSAALISTNTCQAAQIFKLNKTTTDDSAVLHLHELGPEIVSQTSKATKAEEEMSDTGPSTTSTQSLQEQLKQIRDQLQVYMAPMTNDDWYEYLGGVAIGGIVQTATSTELDVAGSCFSQIAAVSESGFLAYYYAQEYWHPVEGQEPDLLSIAYASFYLGRLIEALEMGGCMEITVNQETVIDYFESQSKQTSRPGLLGQEATSNTQDPSIESIPNPFSDGAANYEEFAQWSQAILSMVEAAIDTETFIEKLSQEKYLQAGVFTGRGIVNLALGIRDLIHAIAGRQKIDPLQTLDQ